MNDDLRVSCVVVGNEILRGHVVDENVPVLARTLARHGVPLDHVAVVPDDVQSVATAVRRELERSSPRLVVTSGGLGPTMDDVTHEGVATALNAPLVVAPELEKPVREAVKWYREKHEFPVDSDALDAWMRIARVPEGAEVFRHRRWLAAVAVDVGGGIDLGGACVLSLPGPPGHFRALLEEVVVPRYVEGRGRPSTTVEISHGYPETLLAGAFERVQRACPETSLGSYPGTPMVIRLEGLASDVSRAAGLLRLELDRLDEHPHSSEMRATWLLQPVEWASPPSSGGPCEVARGRRIEEGHPASIAD